MAKQWHQLERLDHKALKKLQQEREKAAKLAEQQALRNKSIVVGAIILFIIIGAIVLGIVLKKRSDAKELEAKREECLYSSVSEFLGTVDYRQRGDWTPLTRNLKFKEEYSFKTSEESSITVLLQKENQIKLYSTSEVLVTPPILEKVGATVKKQNIELIRGEMTSAISIDGRGLLFIQVSNITIVGQSGLFKVIYNDETDKGEVVVKNGLVEVNINNSSEKPTKISGFYKVSFEKGELSSPTQASVIQYDWQ